MSSDYVYHIYTEERRKELARTRLEDLEHDIYDLEKKIASGNYDQSEIQHLRERRGRFIAEANALKPDVPNPNE